MEYNLDCKYDSRKSFYGKAIVEQYDLRDSKGCLCSQIIKLYSYNTLVATVELDLEHNKKIYKYLGKYSQTTTRHQKEFFKQQGLDDTQIKELFKNGELELRV